MYQLFIKAKVTIDNVDLDLIGSMYKGAGEVDPARLKQEEEFLPNEFVILRNGKKSCINCS